jgi:TPR repeat protein
MGQSETRADEDTRTRLLEAARAMVLRGDSKFSVASLCAETGVDRVAFRAHFAGKTALMAALMQVPSVTESVPVAVAAPEPASPEPVSKAVPESSVPAPDAWLERRLRVFERALNTLEAKAENAARDHARAIAQLEERLSGVPHSVAAPALVPAPVKEDATPAPLPGEAPQVPQQVDAPRAPQVHSVELAGEMQAEVAPAEEMGKQAAQELLALPPLPATTLSKEEMTDMLQTVRDKVRAAAEPQALPPDNSKRTRWLAIGALSLVALFLCIGLSLGKNLLGSSASAQESDGVTYRHAASSTLARTIALADAGNTRAQARLALAYLRGQGSARDANAALLWGFSAAKAGDPVAQYLLGALYQQGDHVKTDPGRAFVWFSRAAEKGNLKAMHNLAIAYAQGQGTAKDEAKAAEWFTRAAERGYVDSAFDLAVLYERGTGVKQDLRQALKWYDIAAMAGDAPSKERVDFLGRQMGAADIKLATNAAAAFSPLPALGEANSL